MAAPQVTRTEGSIIVPISTASYMQPEEVDAIVESIKRSIYESNKVAFKKNPLKFELCHGLPYQTAAEGVPCAITGEMLYHPHDHLNIVLEDMSVVLPEFAQEYDPALYAKWDALRVIYAELIYSGTLQDQKWATRIIQQRLYFTMDTEALLAGFTERLRNMPELPF
jgi:hypothetical protein